METDMDESGYVTADNTGGHFVCECEQCGSVFNSRDSHGGEPIANAGDHGRTYCPSCGCADPGECCNPNLVWNVQQRKINLLQEQNNQLIQGLHYLLDNLSLSDAATSHVELVLAKFSAVKVANSGSDRSVFS